MATMARDNGWSAVVANEDLMVLLTDMLEKMNLVEAKLMQLRQQGTSPSPAGADVRHAASQADRVQSTAREIAAKAIEVAREAVLFCSSLDNAYCRLKPRRVLEH